MKVIAIAQQVECDESMACRQLQGNSTTVFRLACFTGSTEWRTSKLQCTIHFTNCRLILYCWCIDASCTHQRMKAGYE